MLSKTLCFNRTLFRKNLSRFWPLWGMATFAGALLPAAMLLNMAHTHIQHYEFARLYYETLVYAVPIISLLYAILCAAVVWDFLYHPRSVGMMHTLPIRRQDVFVTNFFSGMSMMLIPYVVTGTLCVLVTLLANCFSLQPLLETILGVLGMSFFYYCSATFAIFLTGNLFMLPALYFLLHFLAPLLDWLCSLFSQQLIYGLSGNYSGALDCFSPTVFLMQNMEVETLQQLLPNPDFPSETVYTVVGVELHGLWIVGAYALAGLVLLGIAWCLYRSRRSECAGDVIAVKWMKPVFRFGVAILVSMTGGLLLYFLLWSSFQSSTLMEPLPLTLCMMVAGAIGYYAASMLLAKNLRVFRGSWKGLVLVVAFSAGLCFSLSTDLLGIGSRVPALENIQSLSFRVSENGYTFKDGFLDDTDEAALVEQILDLHTAITADLDYIVEYLDHNYTWDGVAPVTYCGTALEDYALTHIRFSYQLKDGSTLVRRYTLPLSPTRLTQDETYDAKLNALVELPAMRGKRLLMDQPEYQIYDAQIWLDFASHDNLDSNYSDFSQSEIQQLWDAIRQDAMEGTWGTPDWFNTRLSSRYAMSIDISLRAPDPERDSSYLYESLYIYVYPEMQHTLAFLLKHEIISSLDDLMTYPELEVANFRQELKETFDLELEDLTREELRKYADELGYSYTDLLEILYGETGGEDITENTFTVVTAQTPHHVQTEADIEIVNSAPAYVTSSF